jgi:hypothetical protein
MVALGVMSLGRPMKRSRRGGGEGVLVSARGPSSPRRHSCQAAERPRPNLRSQSTISFQAPSFRKLCTSTMLSTASAGVSVKPFRSMALYICCGEGYSQFPSWGAAPLGIEDMEREVGRSIGWSGARDCEMLWGI